MSIAISFLQKKTGMAKLLGSCFSAMEFKITMMDVIREMGFEPNTVLDTKAGQKMAKWYRHESGYAPGKDNHKKVNGKGNHCHADYDPSYRTQMKKIVLEAIAEMNSDQVERSRQMDLFRPL